MSKMTWWEAISGNQVYRKLTNPVTPHFFQKWLRAERVALNGCAQKE